MLSCVFTVLCVMHIVYIICTHVGLFMHACFTRICFIHHSQWLHCITVVPTTLQGVSSEAFPHTHILPTHYAPHKCDPTHMLPPHTLCPPHPHSLCPPHPHTLCPPSCLRYMAQQFCSTALAAASGAATGCSAGVCGIHTATCSQLAALVFGCPTIAAGQSHHLAHQST